MQVVKDANYSSLTSKPYYTYKGPFINWFPDFSPPRAGLLLNDGTLLAFEAYQVVSCSNSVNGMDICGWIYVDVNGEIGPNMMGKDFHVFDVVKRRSDNEIMVFPAGTPNIDTYTCNANVAAASYTNYFGCTQKFYTGQQLP